MEDRRRAVWVTGNYDPETNIAYWGTGNGGPWMGDQRPGDNLYVASTIALDVATGQIKGHFQYNPNESWDWDEVSPPLLIDFQRNGRTVKGLVNVARDGYLWFLERSDRSDHVRRRQAVRASERVHAASIRRPASPTSIRRTSRHRQARRVLPALARRQELAADRVQPADADDLHSRQQQLVRDARPACR